MFLCQQYLTLLVKHPGLLGHTSGVLSCLLSRETRYQAHVVDSRLKSKTEIRSSTEVLRNDPNRKILPRRNRSEAMLSNIGIQLALQSTLSVSHFCNHNSKSGKFFLTVVRVESQWKQALWQEGAFYSSVLQHSSARVFYPTLARQRGQQQQQQSLYYYFLNSIC